MAAEGDQPILLVPSVDARGAAPHVAVADGHWPDPLPHVERLYYFFDEGSLVDARGGWLRSLAAVEMVERHYWKQTETGGWVEGP